MNQNKPAAQTWEMPGIKGKIWRWAGLVGGGVVALVIALTLLQCGIKKPEAPTWNSRLQIPLASDHLDVANLLLRLDDGDMLVGDDGSIGLFLADTLDTVTIGASLAVPSQFLSVPQEIGRVNFEAPEGDSVRADLVDYYVGLPGLLPPFDVFDIDTLGPIEEYTWIAVANGEAYLKVTNEFGLDFDSVTVTLVDLVTGPVGVFDFPGGIPAGTADSQAVGLVGRQLYNRFRYQLYAHSPGGTLLSLSNRYLDVSFGFTDTVQVDSGLLEVPQITRAHSDIIGFSGNGDLLSIRSADLAQGLLEITVENRTNLTAGLTCAVPSFTRGGVALSRNLAVLPWDTAYVAVNLNGYTFVPEEPNAPQYFVVNVIAATIPTGPNHVLIRPHDTIAVTSRITNMQGQRVTGVLAPQRIALPTFQQNTSIPSDLTAFHPAEATLQFEVVNGSGADAALDLQLSANNGNNLSVSGFAAAGSPALPVVSLITEPNLAAFLDPYPGQVQITGTATFGDSTSEVTLDAADFALARVTVSAPLAVRVDPVTIEGPAERQDISGSDVGEIIEHLESGALHLNVSNHLPLDAEISIYVATDSTNVYTLPDLLLGPVSVTAGATNISGLVYEITQSENRLDLDQTDLQLFASPTLFFGYRIMLPGSAGQIVRVTAADYLDLTAYFTVVMRNGKGVW